MNLDFQIVFVSQIRSDLIRDECVRSKAECGPAFCPNDWAANSVLGNESSPENEYPESVEQFLSGFTKGSTGFQKRAI